MVSVKGLVASGLALLALMAAYLVGANGRPALTPAEAADDTGSAALRSVAVVGRGTASAVPDQLSFALSATAKSTDLDQALADSSAAMRRALDALAEFGVEKGDTQTTGLSMDPEYYYPEGGPPVLTGYRVTQRAKVEVSELAQGGKAIGAVVRAGGDAVRVSSIQLEVSDPEAAMARARDDAMAQAEAKAEQYAAAAGATLGDVVTIRETAVPQTVELQYARLDAAKAAPAVPLRAGRTDLTVRVSVVWELE